MSPGFELGLPSFVFFGPGVAARAAEEALKLGSRIFLVCGSSETRCAPLAGPLQKAGASIRYFRTTGEPTVSMLEQALREARGFHAEAVAGMGGGSALDLAKAVAALYPCEGPAEDFLEVIGRGRKMEKPGLPMIAVPTTAGTGAEATKNAVILSEKHMVKVSLRGPQLMPLAAAIDPELCLGLPPQITASTGLDALCQLIESFTARKANAFTDQLCREGITRAARSLKAAFLDGADIHAREDMSLAAFFSGVALANAGLGAVHGLAGPLGGMLGGRAPHGMVCAGLLCAVTRVNLRALGQQESGRDALARYGEIARLTAGANASPGDLVSWLESLKKDLAVPSLKTLGLGPERLEEAAEKGLQASSMRANPAALSREVLLEVLEESL